MNTLHILFVPDFDEPAMNTVQYSTPDQLAIYFTDWSDGRTIIRVTPEYAISVDTELLISEARGAKLRTEINRLIKEYSESPRR